MATRSFQNRATNITATVRTGYTGSLGFTGSRGSDGIIGVNGYTGSAGSDGTTGFTGSAGNNGSTGFTGSAGSNGTTGFTGSAGNVATIYDTTTESTGYFALSAGNTAQRPGSPEVGQIRYNTTLGLGEIYTISGWSIFGVPPPEISTVSPASYNGESNTEFTINGSNFKSDAVVKFVDNAGIEYTAGIVTFVDSTTLLARTPLDFTVAQEPLDVKVIQESGQATKFDCIDCGGTPSWTTASGSLGSINMNSAVSFQVAATDPDANSSITYSVTVGSLPANVSLNGSTGLISGTAPSVSGDTTYTFTVSATDNAGNQSNREFSITVLATDPYFSQVVLLLHGDGTSGSTSIIDSSNSARTFTRVGNPVINTSIKKYGTGSIAVLGGGNTASFYQSGGSITIASMQAFTVEAWVYLMASGRHILMGEPSGSAYATAWGFGIFDTSGPSAQSGETKGLCWWLSPINGYGGNVVYSGQYPTLETWTHLAICRNSSGNWKFFMNGVLGTTKNANALVDMTYSGFPSNDGPTGAMTFPVHVGNFDGFTSGGNSAYLSAGFNGYIDEFRITVGTARYSTTFTPAAGPFPNS